MTDTDEEIDRFPGLAEWWRESCALWVQYREETSTGSLEERADYKSGLTAQFPISSQRVVYAASGSRPTGTRVTDPRIVVEKSAYWISVSKEQEAHYLVALLNSSTLDEAVKPYQPVGIGGARHFDKNIFEVARLPEPAGRGITERRTRNPRSAGHPKLAAEGTGDFPYLPHIGRPGAAFPRRASGRA